MGRQGSERTQVALVCERCDSRNYKTTKTRKVGDNDRLKLKKHCPSCNAHTIHKESR